MRAISDELVRTLTKTLSAAEAISREHAAYQSYRADAARVMGERVLTGYHHSQHEQAIALSAALAEARCRVQAAPQVPRRAG